MAATKKPVKMISKALQKKTENMKPDEKFKYLHNRKKNEQIRDTIKSSVKKGKFKLED